MRGRQLLCTLVTALLIASCTPGADMPEARGGAPTKEEAVLRYFRAVGSGSVNELQEMIVPAVRTQHTQGPIPGFVVQRVGPIQVDTVRWSGLTPWLYVVEVRGSDGTGKSFLTFLNVNKESDQAPWFVLYEFKGAGVVMTGTPTPLS